jgi:hypothetical protein
VTESISYWYAKQRSLNLFPPNNGKAARIDRLVAVPVERPIASFHPAVAPVLLSFRGGERVQFSSRLAPSGNTPSQGVIHHRIELLYMTSYQL